MKKQVILPMQYLAICTLLSGCGALKVAEKNADEEYNQVQRETRSDLGIGVSDPELDKGVKLALEKLFKSAPSSKKLYSVAKGVLVFPDVVKGGLIIGGQFGKGSLLVNNRTAGYYRTTAASYGLQAGVQSFGYAMFFMTEESLKYLYKSSGWEIGVGPSVVIMDEGLAKSLTTTTAKDDVYAFFFDQKGLMAGIGIQGSKITEFTPKD